MHCCSLSSYEVITSYTVTASTVVVYRRIGLSYTSIDYNSGCSGRVVEYRTRNREVAGSTHTRSTASNLEQVANLLRAQANSASYHQRYGKWVVAMAARWRPSADDWDNGWPHNALRHHWVMLISCHFRDCKALLVTSLTHVSGAIISVETFTFYLHSTDNWH